MPRLAFAGKQELTQPPAHLDQRSNLSSCSPHGPYEFLGKSNQFHVVHATRPSRRAEIEEPLQQKARQMPSFSIFGAFIQQNIACRTSAVNPALVKMPNI
jgi:hypothetical protein